LRQNQSRIGKSLVHRTTRKDFLAIWWNVHIRRPRRTRCQRQKPEDQGEREPTDGAICHDVDLVFKWGESLPTRTFCSTEQTISRSQLAPILDLSNGGMNSNF
jgi:hypothetical protein